MEKGHGRIDERGISVMAIETATTGLPYVTTLIKVNRKSTAYKEDNKASFSLYVSSCLYDRYTPEGWLNKIRGHWAGSEIRNHWRKDACLQEDKTRSRNPNMVGVFAMLRNIMLYYFIEQDIHSTLTGYVECLAATPSKPFSMIMGRE